jgi:four helix bundle protein
MATVKRFEELEIWQKARKLCGLIYTFIQRERFSRDYKLVNQINASSGSAMDNIAEGFGRRSRNEFVQFLSITNGSASEVQSQLYRALDREYISEEEFNDAYQISDEICAGTNNLMKYLNKSEYKGEKFMNRVGEPALSYMTEEIELPF